jgi:hypothetical protein
MKKEIEKNLKKMGFSTLSKESKKKIHEIAKLEQSMKFQQVKLKKLNLRYEIVEDPNNSGAWGVYDNKEKTLVRDEKYSQAKAGLMAAKLNLKNILKLKLVNGC